MNRDVRCSTSHRLFAPLVCSLVLAAMPAAAQSTREGSAVPASAPATPVVTRDAAGRVVIRATRITQPIRMDGRLDDAAYQAVSPITEFIQSEPDEGAPITERD